MYEGVYGGAEGEDVGGLGRISSPGGRLRGVKGGLTAWGLRYVRDEMFVVAQRAPTSQDSGRAFSTYTMVRLEG